MDAGALDEFHDARQEDPLAVADRVDLYLLAHKVFIDEHGLFRIDGECVGKVSAEHGLIGHDLHRAAAEDKARPDEHGIADLRGRRRARFHIRHGNALRIRDPERLNDCVERVAVFSLFDRVAAGAEDAHTAPR